MGFAPTRKTRLSTAHGKRYKPEEIVRLPQATRRPYPHRTLGGHRRSQRQLHPRRVPKLLPDYVPSSSCDCWPPETGVQGRPRNHVSGRLAVDSRSPTSSRGRLRFVSPAQMSLVRNQELLYCCRIRPHVSGNCSNITTEADGSVFPSAMPAIRLILLIGCRRNEIFTLRWPVWATSADSALASQLDDGRVQHRTGRKRNRDASLCAHARLRGTGDGTLTRP